MTWKIVGYRPNGSEWAPASWAATVGVFELRLSNDSYNNSVGNPERWKLYPGGDEFIAETPEEALIQAEERFASHCRIAMRILAATGEEASDV